MVKDASNSKMVLSMKAISRRIRSTVKESFTTAKANQHTMANGSMANFMAQGCSTTNAPSS